MDLLIAFTLIIILFSIIIHEISHGYVAYYMGDPTAKLAGRLTLNPLSHLDPVGSVLLPLFLAFSGLPIIGWAKPVPINPAYFRDRKYGELKVSLAGPLSNISIALIFGIITRFFPLPSGFIDIFSVIIFYNFALAIFNLIPIPPLDGSHVLFSLMPGIFNNFKFFLEQYGFIILVFIIFLIPNSLTWIFVLAQNMSLFLLR